MLCPCVSGEDAKPIFQLAFNSLWSGWTSKVSIEQSSTSMTADASGSTASASSEEDEDQQFVFLMLLDGQATNVLMLEEDGEWYLPYFEYPYRSGEHKADACLQLQKKLGIHASQPLFTGLFDPLGFSRTESIYGKQAKGYSHLLLLESHCAHFKPESPAAWHDVDSVLLISENANRSRGPDSPVHEIIFEIVHQFLTGEYTASYLSDVRYRPGWFKSASQYLTSVLTEIGVKATKPVLQHSLSSTSTVLKVDSDHGMYFLKAPAAGCNEVLITEAVVEHLGHHTRRVVGTNADLNCFVSESFEELSDGDSDLRSEMIDKLAQVQLDSLHCLDKLKEGGVSDRSPLVMIQQIDKWLGTDTTLKDLLQLGFPRFSDNAEAIKQALMELHECGIPLTLVHADAYEPNFAYKVNEAGERDLILYNWQYSCISHPFFDFHYIHERLSPGEIESYLQKWSHLVSMKKIHRAFELARITRWMIKVWFAVDCLNACLVERIPILFELLYNTLEMVIFGLKQFAEREEDRDSVDYIDVES